jgi:hypothetical protein
VEFPKIWREQTASVIGGSVGVSCKAAARSREDDPSRVEREGRSP